MTLREVENETGITNGYISQLENGRVKHPSYEFVMRLYAVYGERHDTISEINNFDFLKSQLTISDIRKVMEYMEFLNYQRRK